MNVKCNFSFQAVEVIKDLEKKNEALINGKSEANETQLNRLSEYLTLLSSCNISNDAKAKYLSKLSELFKNKKISEELNENYKKIFEKYEFGKNFIKKLNGKIDEVQTTEISDSSKQTSEGTEKTNKKTERTGLQTEGKPNDDSSTYQES